MTTRTYSTKLARRKPRISSILVPLFIIGGLSSLAGCSGTEVADSTQAPSATATPEAATPEPSETPTEAAEPAVDEVARAAALEQAIKDSLGVETFAELYASDPTLWGGYINGVRTANGNAFITLQVAADDPARDDLGQRAAQALSTLLPASAVEDINFLVVEDAAGVVIDQKQPAPLS